MYNKKMAIVLVNEQSPLKYMQVLLIRFVIESVCIHHTRIGFHASQQVGGYISVCSLTYCCTVSL